VSIQRFEELARAWGAEPSRWPEAERALFARHAGTPEGARILARAAGLDRVLDSLQPRAADPLRPARIARTARAQQARRRRGVAWASGAWAASAVLGFMLGYLEPASDTDASDDPYAQLLTGSTVLEDFL
jgi:hypothetical protein